MFPSGVFIPTFQNIMGIILFLRLPWITGQAGIAQVAFFCAKPSRRPRGSLSSSLTGTRSHACSVLTRPRPRPRAHAHALTPTHTPTPTPHPPACQGLGVVLLSCLASCLTSLSMSAVATNGKPQSGGCYSIIKSSLGPEFGGTVGLLLFLSSEWATAARQPLC